MLRCLSLLLLTLPALACTALNPAFDERDNLVEDATSEVDTADAPGDGDGDDGDGDSDTDTGDTETGDGDGDGDPGPCA
ncbi:hypothetical protein, partial [Enhygromyxa salina]|uniref:hypothetical protein n=1 Tax=Enhygromyxa salina TaxID=215803 RepID=UPI00196A1953